MPKFGITGSDICITTAAKISEDGASGRFTDMAIIAVSRLAPAWAPMTPDHTCSAYKHHTCSMLT